MSGSAQRRAVRTQILHKLLRFPIDFFPFGVPNEHDDVVLAASIEHEGVQAVKLAPADIIVCHMGRVKHVMGHVHRHDVVVPPICVGIGSHERRDHVADARAGGRPIGTVLVPPGDLLLDFQGLSLPSALIFAVSIQTGRIFSDPSASKQIAA